MRGTRSSRVRWSGLAGVVARATLVLAAWLVAAPVAAQAAPSVSADPPPSRSRTAGAMVGLELGSHLGGHGVGLDYVVPLVDAVAVGAHVGVGLSGGSDPPSGKERLAAWDSRLSLILGRRIRVLVGVGYALLARRSLTLHGTLVDTRGVYGPVGVAGTELLLDGGFFVRFMTGFGYARAVAEHPGSWVDQSLCLAVGLKLW